LTPPIPSFMMAAMNPRFRRPLTLAACAFFISLACNRLGPAIETATSSPPPPTPSSTPTPAPTQTPTAEPLAQLDSADQSLRDGDWDQALTAYQAAAKEDASPEIRAAAEFGEASTLLRAGRDAEAITALSSLIADESGSDQAAQAYFLRAVAYQQADEPELALSDYQAYLESRPGRIDSLVEERIGDLLCAQGRPAEAIAHYRQAAQLPHLGGSMLLEIKAGRAQMEAGDAAAALAAFDSLQAAAQDSSTKATLNYLAGLALTALGDLQGAHDRYLDSIDKYPEAYDAYSGLLLLVKDNVPVPDLRRGEVDYFAGAYQPALDAFNRAAETAPSGTLFYYRGLTRRSLGDWVGARDDLLRAAQAYPNDPHRQDAWLEQARTEWAYLDRYSEAVQTYLDFVAAFPESPAAADALFAAGRTAERHDQLEQAAEIWLRLPSEYPANALAYQGGFEAAIVRYRLANYAGSLNALKISELLAGSPGQVAALNLWRGKNLLAMAQPEGARQAWEQASRDDPTGYYSDRADDLLAGKAPFQASGIFDFSTDPAAEKSEAESWLRQHFPITGTEPLSQLDPALANDDRWIRGQELLALGQFADADNEFEALRTAYQGNAEATYRLMNAFLDGHLYRQAILASRQVLQLAGMDDAQTMQAPVYFNHVRFGPYFGEIILPEAIRSGLDGLFLLSVVRQESLFEGYATSYAEARGLMQVIPSTGASIAKQLGWPPDYSDADLYRPMVSVRFGSFYLAAQSSRFDGDLFAALAAYNAGPGNALAWKALAPDDPDLFLEVIRLTQPHLYIRTIYEVFTIYNRLYVQP
jgi:soluble lytic murein transglycosylase